MSHSLHPTLPVAAPEFSILIADDDDSVRDVLVQCLRSASRRVSSVNNGVDAVSFLQRHRADLLFLDINMPGPDGIETLKQIRRGNREVTIVMVTGYGTIQNAIDAMKSGADEFLLKPVLPEDARNLADRVELQKGPRKLLSAASDEDSHLVSGGSSRLLTVDPAMNKTFNLIERVAPLPSTVLIEGESGTGKELIAKELHEASSRAGHRFVAFNCAVIPDHLLESELFGHEQGAFTGATRRKVGYFEAAQGGTIFLDEIGEMSFDLQAKLLRVIQERTFRRVGGIEEIPTDVRIVAATNRDLERETAEGRFRKDLFYRINVVKITVPPLRDRPADIPLLSQYFVNRYAQEFAKPVSGIDLDVLDLFRSHRWEGNVRELQNVIERAVAVTAGDEITREDLPEEFACGDFPDSVTDELKPYQAAKTEFEARYVKHAMREADGNIALASRLAGISRQNLYEKLARYGIEQEDFRSQTPSGVA